MLHYPSFAGRGAARFSAPALGAGGPGFESQRPDHLVTTYKHSEKTLLSYAPTEVSKWQDNHYSSLLYLSLVVSLNSTSQKRCKTRCKTLSDKRDVDSGLLLRNAFVNMMLNSTPFHFPRAVELKFQTVRLIWLVPVKRKLLVYLFGSNVRTNCKVFV